MASLHDDRRARAARRLEWIHKRRRRAAAPVAEQSSPDDFRALIAGRIAKLEDRRGGQMIDVRAKARIVDRLAAPGSSWRRQLEGLHGQPGAGLPPALPGLPAPKLPPLPTLEQEAAAAAAAVQNLTGNVSAPSYRERAQAKRRQRVKLRDYVTTLTRNARVIGCGRRMVGEAVSLIVGETRAAHYGGLMFCGRIWLCPVCAAKVAAERTRELLELLERHRAAGGGAIFATLTVPHSYGDDLGRARRLVADLFRRAKQGRAWQADAAAIEFVGYVRALEATHGANGWHPHLHVVILTKRPLPAAEVEAFRQSFAGRWIAACDKATGRRPLMKNQVIRAAVGGKDIAEYVAKMGRAEELGEPLEGERSIALEVTRWDAKAGYTNGARPGRTPFQLLAQLHAHAGELARLRRRGERADRARMLYLDKRIRRDGAIWREWERGIRGAKQLTWSVGLRERYDLREATDEDIANARVGGVELVQLSRAMWHIITQTPALPSLVLDEAERGGASAVDALLRNVVADRERAGIGVEPGNLDDGRLWIVTGVALRAPPTG